MIQVEISILRELIVNNAEKIEAVFITDGTVVIIKQCNHLHTI